jgi:hypothetical protein
LKEVDREYARIQLKQRIDQLCEKYSFKYNRLFIRNQKTRWGSTFGGSNTSVMDDKIKRNQLFFNFFSFCFFSISLRNLIKWL